MKHARFGWNHASEIKIEDEDGRLIYSEKPPLEIQKILDLHEEKKMTRLPATDGKWCPYRNRSGMITGWFEMFPDEQGRFFTIPGASRYVPAGKRDAKENQSAP